MSKAIKKIGRAVKKGLKWVSKNIMPLLAVAALVYTGGAAMGFFQGVAGGGGATGLAGIKAAFGGMLGTGASAGSAGASMAGTTATTTAAAPGMGMMPGMMPAAIPESIIASGAQAAAAPVAAAVAPSAAGGMSVGKGLMAAAGIQAGGAFLSAKAAEDEADEERMRQEQERGRYNKGMYAFGVNRNGETDANYTGGNWDQMMAPAPAGLMAPKPVAPQTIDDLIRARQQGLA